MSCIPILRMATTPLITKRSSQLVALWELWRILNVVRIGLLC
jgi:hypothetical protein